MQHFYQHQRRRLDVLMDGRRPVGGRWSFDTENRRRLPRDVELPPWPTTEAGRHVPDAQAWVRSEFPDNPGEVDDFRWPTTHEQADAWLDQFLEERFAQFGPYEDAIAAEEPWLFHSALSSSMNTGSSTRAPW